MKFHNMFIQSSHVLKVLRDIMRYTKVCARYLIFSVHSPPPQCMKYQDTFDPSMSGKGNKKCPGRCLKYF